MSSDEPKLTTITRPMTLRNCLGSVVQLTLAGSYNHTAPKPVVTSPCAGGSHPAARQSSGDIPSAAAAPKKRTGSRRSTAGMARKCLALKWTATIAPVMSASCASFAASAGSARRTSVSGPLTSFPDPIARPALRQKYPMYPRYPPTTGSGSICTYWLSLRRPIRIRETPTMRVDVRHCQRAVATSSGIETSAARLHCTRFRTMAARKIRPTSWICPTAKTIEDRHTKTNCMTAELRK
mmetsp:Transcript_59334/g.167142  ORF Transcript_59334/g.167142 Transcript_59334/m.167142 type:complete len:238 (-) Transcript_59334:237-950(-)